MPNSYKGLYSRCLEGWKGRRLRRAKTVRGFISLASYTHHLRPNDVKEKELANG